MTYEQYKADGGELTREQWTTRMRELADEKEMYESQRKIAIYQLTGYSAPESQD